VPKLSLVHPNNHDVVYYFQDTALFALYVRAMLVLACVECLVDRVFQDPLFQYSRFIDAWERPTVRGDSPASSDGTCTSVVLINRSVQLALPLLCQSIDCCYSMHGSDSDEN